MDRTCRPRAAGSCRRIAVGYAEQYIAMEGERGRVGEGERNGAPRAFLLWGKCVGKTAACEPISTCCGIFWIAERPRATGPAPARSVYLGTRCGLTWPKVFR